MKRNAPDDVPAESSANGAKTDPANPADTAPEQAPRELEDGENATTEAAGAPERRTRPPFGPTSIALLTVAATVIALLGLKETSGILMPTFLAINLVLAGLPLQRFLARFMPGILASVLMMVTLFAILAAMLGSLVWAIWVAADELPSYSARFTALYNSSIEWLGTLGLSEQQIGDAFGGITPSTVIGYVQTFAASLSDAGTQLMILVIAMFFLCFDVPSMAKRWQYVASRNPAVAEALQDFSAGVRSYWIVSTVFGLIVAVMDYVALLILQVPLAAVWAILAFVTNYIPNIGFVIGLVPPALFALLIGGPKTAIWVIVVYSVINLVMQSFIQPKFTGDAVGLTPTVTFLSLAFWSMIAGPLAAILAVPLTLAFKALFLDPDPRMDWFSAFLTSTNSDTKKKKRRAKNSASAPRGDQHATAQA